MQNLATTYHYSVVPAQLKLAPIVRSCAALTRTGLIGVYVVKCMGYTCVYVGWGWVIGWGEGGWVVVGFGVGVWVWGWGCLGNSGAFFVGNATRVSDRLRWTVWALVSP